MRRLMLIAAGVAALTAAGIAVAAGLHDARSVKAVTGTFNATGATVTTRSCKTSDGKTITVTNGRYTGIAAGDPDLAGAIRIDARSLITSDDVGTVEGKLRIDVASGEDTVAHFSAVYDHGKLAGLAGGHAHDPKVKLLGNISAGFSAAGPRAAQPSSSAPRSASRRRPRRRRARPVERCLRSRRCRSPWPA
jgi:hypothetical protein